MRRAVILLSGGMDSATVAAMAQAEGYRLYALTFDYGQRHSVEIRAARSMARYFKVSKHLVLRIPLDRIGGSALTDRKRAVPKNRKLLSMSREIPVTYVPGRNTIFLSIATAWAEVIGAGSIFIGANSLDYSGYPDCRPAYFTAFERVARLGTRAGVEGPGGVRIRAPLLKKSKAEIVRIGLRLGVPYHKTISCYDPRPSGNSCGRCDACLLREKGMREATGRSAYQK
jgi:7-cyano-7-deazaguanine synthase